tara:strand:- start:535 stop:1536 length:1002 start_codon:yes stop_codon:yes gene_type:complete
MVYETVRTVLFYLDTRYRSAGTIGQPRFTFPNNLIDIKPQDGESIRLTMQEASLEYTFYQTEEFNNKVMITEAVSGAGAPAPSQRLVQIPVGNYNLPTFVVQLTQSLNANSLYRYILTYQPATNQLKYTATPLNGFNAVSVTFNFNPEEVFAIGGFAIQESLNEIMGFEVGAVIDLTFNAANTALTTTSTTPVTVSPGVQNLYVTIQNSCSNFGNANIVNTFSASNILAKIPVSNPPFSTLYFYDLNGNFSTVIVNKYIDNLNLSLFNERFTVIEPRKDWTFTIKIDIIRGRAENETSKLTQELVDMTKLKMINKDQTKKKEAKKSQKSSIKK